MAHDIFVSYSRRDSELVQLFVDKLTGLGYSVWIDKDGIESGDAFKKVIVRAIKEARCVVFFSSADSNSSRWTAKEISIAVNKDIPIVPVKLDKAEYNEDLEFDLIDLDYTDYSIPSQREGQMQRFLRSIQRKFPIQAAPQEEDAPSVEPDLIPDELFELAVKYGNGEDGYPKNPEKAFSLYLQAAERTHEDAQVNLGLCYLNGEGVQKDPKKAVYWYAKAAEQKHSIAQYNLGVCYENGYGVKQDPEKAVYWYSKAAEQGYPIAQYNLGVCYENGFGVPQDLEKAVYWYTKAAEQGDSVAQLDLGACYYNGKGVQKNLEKAFAWFTKSAEQGESLAQFSLGVCYEYGNGVKKDVRKAVKWYTKAAEQGYPKAQFNLGWCYESGLGVVKDLEEALSWYKKAAEQGDEDAKKALKRYWKYWK